MEPRVMDVTVDGISTSLLTAGDDEKDSAVVFIHGNPGTGWDWHPMIASVSEFARCIAPTMPGYDLGPRADIATFDFTVNGYAKHLAALIDVLGVRRVHLVTHDLGGIWGLAWASAHPEMLMSLVLMDIGVLPDYRWHRFARLYRMPLVGEFVLAAANRSSTRRALQAGGRRPIPDAFVDAAFRQYRDRATRHAVLAFYRATDALGPMTTQAARAIGGADLPTLVVWGAGDPYVPARYAGLQREFFPRAKVVVLPDSGHWPLIDDPLAVSEAVVPFLREQVAARSPSSRGVAD